MSVGVCFRAVMNEGVSLRDGDGECPAAESELEVGAMRRWPQARDGVRGVITGARWPLQCDTVPAMVGRLGRGFDGGSEDGGESTEWFEVPFRA